MTNKTTFPILAFIAAILLFACQAQKSANKMDKENNLQEQKIIHKLGDMENGYFTVNEGLIDSVEISFYKSMTDKKASIQKTITGTKQISKFVDPLLKLPAKGDIFMKLAATSTRYHIQFFANKKLVGEANIYNNSLQMPNTAFLQKENEFERTFVEKVLQLFDN